MIEESDWNDEPCVEYCVKCGQELFAHEAFAQSDFRGTCDDCLEDADPEAYEAKLHA